MPSKKTPDQEALELRLAEAMEHHIGEPLTEAAMKTMIGTLAGTIDKQVTCTIYERRPSVCRGYERGGPECLRRLLVG